jgi:hypothetical protein
LGIFCGALGGTFWCISWSFGIFLPFGNILLEIWFFVAFFPVLVCRIKKNLATLTAGLRSNVDLQDVECQKIQK